MAKGGDGCQDHGWDGRQLLLLAPTDSASHATDTQILSVKSDAAQIFARRNRRLVRTIVGLLHGFLGHFPQRRFGGRAIPEDAICKACSVSSNRVSCSSTRVACSLNYSASLFIVCFLLSASDLLVLRVVSLSATCCRCCSKSSCILRFLMYNSLTLLSLCWSGFLGIRSLVEDCCLEAGPF